MKIKEENTDLDTLLKMYEEYLEKLDNLNELLEYKSNFNRKD